VFKARDKNAKKDASTNNRAGLATPDAGKKGGGKKRGGQAEGKGNKSAATRKQTPSLNKTRKKRRGKHGQGPATKKKERGAKGA